MAEYYWELIRPKLIMDARVELISDIVKELTPAERWVWYGIRILAASLKTPDRISTRKLPDIIDTPPEICRSAIIKLKRLQAAKLEDDKLTIYPGFNPGDRKRNLIIYQAIKYLNERLAKRTSFKRTFIRVNLMGRINEGASLEDIKKIIDYMAENKLELPFHHYFRKRRFWKILNKEE